MIRGNSRFVVFLVLLSILAGAVASALAAPVITYSSNSDNTTWILPSGTNLLAGAVTSPATANTHEGSSADWTTLTNGYMGANGDKSTSVTPNNGDSVVFTLNTVGALAAGYNLTSFDSYCAWPDNGRSAQNFQIDYSTVSAPNNWIQLAIVNCPNNGDPSTHANLVDSTGTLATGVGAIRFDFGTPNGQESGYVGYRQFVLLGASAFTAPLLTWTGATGPNWNTTEANWTGASTTYSDSSADVFPDSAAHTSISVAAGGVQPFSMTFNNSSTPYTIGGGAILGPTSIALQGAGTVTLTASNRYTGGTTISASANAVLNVANNNALGTGALTAESGTVNFTTPSPVIGGLGGAAGNVVLGNSVGPVNTTLTVGGNNASTTFAGTISQIPSAVGSLVKTGTGTLTLSGTANSYSGATTISQGILVAGVNNLPASSPIVLAGGTFRPVAPGNGLNVNIYTPDPGTGVITSIAGINSFLSGNTPVFTGTTTSGSGAGVYFPDASNGQAFARIGYNGGDHYTAILSGYMNLPVGASNFSTRSDDGSSLFIDGNLVVNNDNYQSETLMGGSTPGLTASWHQVEIAHYQGTGGAGLIAYSDLNGTNYLANSQLYTSIPVTSFANNVAVTSDSTLDLPSGLTFGFGTLSIGSTGSNTLHVTDGPGTATFGATTIAHTPTFDVQGSNVLSLASVSGASGLSKSGNGTLALASPSGNSYVGTTTINAGTLLISNTSGSATGTGNVVVNAGGALSGQGIIVPGGGNSVTVTAGGVLVPHSVPGGYSTLSVSGALNAQSGAIYSYDLGSGQSDFISATNLTLSGSQNFQFAFPNGFVTGNYKLLGAGTATDSTAVLSSSSFLGAETYAFYKPSAVGNPFPGFYSVHVAAQATTTQWWSGALDSTWDIGTTGNWLTTSGNLYTDGQPVVFDDSAVSFNPTIRAGGVNPSTVTFNNSSAHPYTLSALDNNGISGAATVTVNGPGAVTFSSQNSFTGGTFLNGGTLGITNDNQLGTAPSSPAVNLTFNGGTLRAGGVSLSSGRTIQLNTAGGTIDTNGGNVDVNGNLIQGPGALIVIGSGTLKMHDNGSHYQNAFAGGTTVSNATILIPDNGSSSIVTGGAISAGVLGSGPLTLTNGSGLSLINWQEVYWANALKLSGTINMCPPGNGLFFEPSADNITTLSGDATLNINTNADIFGGGYAPLVINQKITGAHSITVNNLGNSSAGLTFGSADNDFSGGVTASNIPITVGAGLSSTVNGGVVTSGPLGTGLITLHAGATLAGGDNGNNETVSNSILIDGNATIVSSHAHFILDPQGSASTFTFVNTPTITNNTFYGDMQINNYVFQGTGFTLQDNHTAGGGGNPLVVSSPGLSQTGMTTSVTLNSSALVYDVGQVAAGNFEFGQGTINLNGGSFTFNAYGATATLTNPVNVGAAGGTLVCGPGYPNSTATFAGALTVSGSLSLVNAGGNGNGQLPFNANLAGLTINPAGSITFGSHNGGTIYAGFLRGSGPLVLQDSAATPNPINLVVDGGGSVNATYSGTMSGPGMLTLNSIDGTGELVLTGTNTYMGGTVVESGTLVLASPAALEDGTSLSVGANAVSIFSTAAASANLSAASAAAVPEPGTLVLLLAGLVVGFAAWTRTRGIR